MTVVHVVGTLQYEMRNPYVKADTFAWEFGSDDFRSHGSIAAGSPEWTRNTLRCAQCQVDNGLRLIGTAGETPRVTCPQGHEAAFPCDWPEWVDDARTAAVGSSSDSDPDGLIEVIHLMLSRHRLIAPGNPADG